MIEFENVTKSFGDTDALHEANILIEDGDFVFLVGPSGAGKSTFIKLILREINADSGRILVDGQDITRFSNRQIPKLRRDIGMVFQDFRLLPHKTVFENVALAMEVIHATQRTIKRQVPQILSVMGIEDKADEFPDHLSAGEQQRVAIARAIINNPKMLIADEPTGNLDPDTAWEIMQLIDIINRRGTTVVMVTHAKDIVNRMGKRVVAIDHGHIVRDSVGGEYGYDD
ncbi:MAG: cell division ATP-binding protein FtsE [Firmicutes bacterium]|nr:cell division ATP-binding protein FtsE [Bacillota bacterium]